MKDDLPTPLKDFIDRYPEIWEAFERLGDACHNAGPLDDRTRRLVNLGIAIGGRLEGAVRSHVRRAISQGITEDEIYHVLVLAITTIGLPSTIAAKTWIENEL